MPSWIRSVKPFTRPWSVCACTLRIAWEWWWSGRRLVLTARAEGRWSSWSSAVDALRFRENQVPIIPKIGPGEGMPSFPWGEPGPWGDSYPLLMGFMTDSTWANGTPRQPAKLFVQLQVGQWVMTLKEPNLNLILTVTVQTPDEMFPAMEAMLRLPAAPWMADPYGKIPKGKKK